jgi:hypothetical protein
MYKNINVFICKTKYPIYVRIHIYDKLLNMGLGTKISLDEFLVGLQIYLVVCITMYTT